MSKSPTLILPPRFTDDSNRIWRAAVRKGWPIERMQSWVAPSHLRSIDVVVYGEPLFVAAVAQQLEIEMIEPPPDWMARLDMRYAKRSIHFTVLSDARRLGQPSFVKPAHDKCFLSTVYLDGTHLPSEDKLDGETEVLWAEPVEFEVEYRCFVHDRKIATWSIYLRDGDIAQGPRGDWPAPDDEVDQMLSWTNEFLADDDVELPHAVGLDVGHIKDKGWAVVELNPAWGCGLCGCNPDRVLDVLRAACRS